MDLLTHTRFTGPALPEPFVRFELERELAQRKLLPKTTGAEGEQVQGAWEVYRRTLRELVAQGGADFAVPERRLAIYIDGASVHVGQNLRRDRNIRDRLRAAEPAWTVVELRAVDLGDAADIMGRLVST